MGLFQVRPEKEEALWERLKALGIREEDLEERFIVGSGKGGQKLQKTSSCVYLKHTPTGIEVKVSRERQQSVNRFLARRQLADAYERIILKRPLAEDPQREKVRKQKDRRARRSKKKRQAGGSDDPQKTVR